MICCGPRRLCADCVERLGKFLGKERDHRERLGRFCGEKCIEEARLLRHKTTSVGYAYGPPHHERNLAAQTHHWLRKIGRHFSGCQPNALAMCGNLTNFGKICPEHSECY